MKRLCTVDFIGVSPQLSLFDREIPARILRISGRIRVHLSGAFRAARGAESRFLQLMLGENVFEYVQQLRSESVGCRD
jgi:hypothetical protein